MKKIFLNPGHMPGVDPGAGGNGLRECDVALAVGTRVKGYLEAAGYEVRLLQSDNLAGESPDYPNVTATANNWDADLLVSLHCNAFNGAARGVETLVYSRGGDAERLAGHIQSQLVDALRAFDAALPDRGIKERPALAVLRASEMPAALVEMAFIDQADDARLLIEREDDIARAIARGVTDYFV